MFWLGSGHYDGHLTVVFARRPHGYSNVLAESGEEVNEAAYREVARAIARQRRDMGLPNAEDFPSFGTGSYLGEGFDDPRLDTLLLAMPILWKGTLQQYVGRLHRLHDNKSEVHVYDYADVMVPMLARMYKKRLAGYSALGYTVAEVVRN